MEFSQGHALLVGVNAYEHAPELDVPATAADARALADVLRDPQLCGYAPSRVSLLCNADATRALVLDALSDLAARTTAENTVFVFYSGHGHYEAGGYCLTTADTRFTAGRKVVDGTAVRQEELLAALQRLAARRVLLIFNACHAGELSPTLSADEAFTGRSVPGEISAALLATGEGRVIITACRERQYSFVGSGTHTIFTEALLDGLRGSDTRSQNGFISVFDLYTHLYSAVGASVQQQVPEQVRRRYAGTQEPELTILKGVGPFAVALYQGASTLGALDQQERPGSQTAVREIDLAESVSRLQQIQQRGIHLGTGSRVGKISQAKTIDRRHVSMQIGTANGVVAGFNDGTINNNAAATQNMPQADLFEQALTAVQQQAKLAQKRGDDDLAADLHDVAFNLQAALKARLENKEQRRLAKLHEASRLLAPLAEEHSSLRDIAQALLEYSEAKSQG